MSLERHLQLACFHVPEAQYSLVIPRGQHLAVVGEGNCKGTHGRSFPLLQSQSLLAGGGIPERDLPTLTANGERFAIGGKGCAKDEVMAIKLQRVAHARRIQVPEPSATALH